MADNKENYKWDLESKRVKYDDETEQHLVWQRNFDYEQLMSSCRVTDAEVKILVAECLGELGAVDPGRLVYIWSCSCVFLPKLVTLLHTYVLRSATEQHAPVVRKLDNVFQRINC